MPHGRCNTKIKITFTPLPVPSLLLYLFSTLRYIIFASCFISIILNVLFSPPQNKCVGRVRSSFVLQLKIQFSHALYYLLFFESSSNLKNLNFLKIFFEKKNNPQPEPEKTKNNEYGRSPPTMSWRTDVPHLAGSNGWSCVCQRWVHVRAEWDWRVAW